MALGLLGADAVASDPIAYVASMTYGILVMFVLPLVIAVLIVSAIVAAILDKAEYAAMLVLCCVLLPVSFFGGLQAMRMMGLAKYETSGFNDMRPIGSELQHRIVFVFEASATQEEINKFDETVLRKSVPQPNGVLLTFADGVCNFSYPENRSGARVVDVPFCANATDEEKQKIRREIVTSPLVRTAFEDVAPGEVQKLK